MVGKIDVHTHALPEFFHKTLIDLGREASGVPMIEWTLEGTDKLMSKLDISTSLLSLSAPGPEVISDAQGARDLAREYNVWASELKKSDPARYGYFAAVPSLLDTEGCLAEIRYAYDHLQADGICFFTTYGGRYLGDKAFEPIWKELDSRDAVVFIHPTMQQGSKIVCDMMQPPAFDFAHETGRTAAHMIVTGMKGRYPKVKIILSHGGGTLPLLSERIAQLNGNLFHDTLAPESPQTSEQILADAKSFYFDLALAGTANVLDSLLNIMSVPQAIKQVLYGVIVLALAAVYVRAAGEE